MKENQEKQPDITAAELVEELIQDMEGQLGNISHRYNTIQAMDVWTEAVNFVRQFLPKKESMKENQEKHEIEYKEMIDKAIEQENALCSGLIGRYLRQTGLSITSLKLVRQQNENGLSMWVEPKTSTDRILDERPEFIERLQVENEMLKSQISTARKEALKDIIERAEELQLPYSRMYKKIAEKLGGK